MTNQPRPQELDVLIFAASLRTNSLNKKLARLAADIANDALQERFEDTLEAFLSLAEAAKHYPCIQVGVLLRAEPAHELIASVDDGPKKGAFAVELTRPHREGITGDPFHDRLSANLGPG